MKNIYKKHNSFSNFKLSKKEDDFDLIKIIEFLKLKIKKEKDNTKKNILEKIVKDLSDEKSKENYVFKLTPNVIEEIKTIDQNKLDNYLYHRYLPCIIYVATTPRFNWHYFFSHPFLG